MTGIVTAFSFPLKNNNTIRRHMPHKAGITLAVNTDVPLMRNAKEVSVKDPKG